MPFVINWKAPNIRISLTTTPIVLFLYLSNTNAMYDYFHDANADNQINNYGNTSKPSLSLQTIALLAYYIMIYAYVN